MLRNYGSRVKYEHEVAGVNSRLDPLQAAFLSVKLTRLAEWNARRAAIAAFYLDALAGMPGLTLPAVLDGAEPSWHLFVVRHARRDALQVALAEAGVQTLIHYPTPPHLQGAYARHGNGGGELSHRRGDPPRDPEPSHRPPPLDEGRRARGRVRPYRLRLPLVKSALRATAILSSGTFVKVVVGIVVGKAWAVLVGPVGVGTLGLLQSLTGLVGIVASLGVASGIVRLGAAAYARGEVAEASVLRQTTLDLSAVAGVLGAIFVIVLRVPLGERLLDGPLALGDALWMGAAVALTVMTGANLGVLNAYQRVGAMARASVWGSLSAGAVGLGVLWVLRADGLVESYVLALAATWAVTAAILHSAVPAEDVKPSWAARRVAGRALLRFGLPFTASALVGTGVTLALPAVILSVLDVESVGMYRAAFAISAGYLGFLLGAMGQDYYPRLAAASDDRTTLRQVVNDQLLLLLLIGGPVVLVGQALAPWIVPVLYTSGFSAAVPVLQWQLTGEIFRFWAWAFSFVVLARSPPRTFFAIEALGGVVLLSGTWLGVHFGGLTGSGVGFMVAYSIYGVVVWAVVQGDLGPVMTGRTWALLGSLLALSFGVHALALLDGGAWQVPASITAALGFSGYSANELLREVRRPKPTPEALT